MRINAKLGEDERRLTDSIGTLLPEDPARERGGETMRCTTPNEQSAATRQAVPSLKRHMRGYATPTEEVRSTGSPHLRGAGLHELARRVM